MASACTAGCSARSSSPTCSASCGRGTPPTITARRARSPSGCSCSRSDFSLGGARAGHRMARRSTRRAGARRRRHSGDRIRRDRARLPAAPAAANVRGRCRPRGSCPRYRPGISGVVADTLGWRWVLLGLLPIVLVAGAIAMPALRRLGAPGGDAPPDRRRDALIVTFGAALVLTAASSRSVVLVPVLAVAGFVFGGRAFARIMPPGTLRLSAGLPAAIAFTWPRDVRLLRNRRLRHAHLTSLRGVGLRPSPGSRSPRPRSTGPRARGFRNEPCCASVRGAFVRTGCLIIAVRSRRHDRGRRSSRCRSEPHSLHGRLPGSAWDLSYSPVSLVVLAEAPVGGEGTASASLQLCDVLGIALGTGVVGRDRCRGRRTRLGRVGRR